MSDPGGCHRTAKPHLQHGITWGLAKAFTLWWLRPAQRLDLGAVMIKCNIPRCGGDLLEPYTNTIGKDYLIWVFYFGRCRPSSLLALVAGWVPAHPECQHEPWSMQEQQLWLRPHGSGFLRSSSTAVWIQFPSPVSPEKRERLLSIFVFNIVKIKLDIFYLKI